MVLLPACLVEAIVVDLFCPYGTINREGGRKIHAPQIIARIFIPNYRFYPAVAVAFCYSCVKKCGTQFTLKKEENHHVPKRNSSASEVDGVQYRRAKLWQIICYALQTPLWA